MATMVDATASHIAQEAAKRKLAQQIAMAKKQQQPIEDWTVFVEKRSDGVWCEYTFIPLTEKCKIIRKAIISFRKTVPGDIGDQIACDASITCNSVSDNWPRWGCGGGAATLGLR